MVLVTVSSSFCPEHRNGNEGGLAVSVDDRHLSTTRSNASHAWMDERNPWQGPLTSSFQLSLGLGVL
jgi:hypothetical protein